MKTTQKSRYLNLYAKLHGNSADFETLLIDKSLCYRAILSLYNILNAPPPLLNNEMGIYKKVGLITTSLKPNKLF